LPRKSPPPPRTLTHQFLDYQHVRALASNRLCHTVLYSPDVVIPHHSSLLIPGLANLTRRPNTLFKNQVPLVYPRWMRQADTSSVADVPAPVKLRDLNLHRRPVPTFRTWIYPLPRAGGEGGGPYTSIPPPPHTHTLRLWE